MVILVCDAAAAAHAKKKLNETQRDTGRPLIKAKEIAKVIDQIEKVGAQVADASCPQLDPLQGQSFPLPICKQRLE